MKRLFAIILACALLWSASEACFASDCAPSSPVSSPALDSILRANTAEKTRENWYWVYLGAGPGIPLGQSGFNVSMANIEVGAAAAFSHHFFAAQGNFALTGLLNGFFSLGAMYGYIQRENWTFSSVSAGLTYMGNGREDTIGLLLEGQIAAKAYLIGVGLKLSANINALYPYCALSVVVPLGWMP